MKNRLPRSRKTVAIEYSLIAALIVIAVILSFTSSKKEAPGPPAAPEIEIVPPE